MNLIVSILQNKPGTTGTVSSVSAWLAYDFLRTAQIAAACLAAIVSMMTGVIIAPAFIARVKDGWAWIKTQIRKDSE